MSGPSPVPMLRAPVPGGARSQSGTRTPRLGLAIPPSPSHRPLANNDAQPPVPPVSLGMSAGNAAGPGQGGGRKLGLKINMAEIQPQSDSSRSRSDSFHNPSVPGSATSSDYSVVSDILRTGGRHNGTPDPASAISSWTSDAGDASSTDRGDSMQSLALDLEKLELEKGAPLDVQDLSGKGWRAASDQGRIVELGHLGEGAGGAVTRCILRGGKKVFALKIITSNPDPDVKKQILRELDFNRTCTSDYICQYYGAFTDKSMSTISIAMEFCEGGSLDSVYKEVKKLGGRTGEKVLGKVAEGVLHGLTYLNGRKIIHRDIKPSNILLCRDGQVKLCDFGVSGEFGTKGEAQTFIGTSYYMAPERIQGQSYTITSDVWSLGVTLLEVAQHRFPFPADGTEMQPKAGLIDLLTYIVAQPIPVLKDEPDNGITWTSGFKYFVQCCLEKEPARRATPWRMLEHPWMAEMKNKKVSMGTFLKQVWDWKDDE